MSKLKLTDREWADFYIKDIFQTYKGPKGLQTHTGAYVSKHLLSSGIMPRITVKDTLNGIDSFCYSTDKNFRFFKNFISVSFLGSVFYHSYEASLDMKVHALVPLEIELNSYTAKFLISAIKNSITLLSYGNQLSSTDLPKVKFLLPINSDGLPDWQFIEDFIKQKEQKQISDLKDYYADKAFELMISTGGLKNTEWQGFKIGKIFEQLLRGSNKGHSNEDCQFGVSYNGAKYNDNGVTGFVETNEKFKIFKGNAIVFVMTGEGSVGLSVYKKEDFVPSSNVFVGYSSVLNRWNGLFLVTAINNGADRYNYGYIRNEKRLFNEKILLPVKSDGLPDWQFMEDFMKQIERDKIATVLSYYNKSLNNNDLWGGRALGVV